MRNDAAFPNLPCRNPCCNLFPSAWIVAAIRLAKLKRGGPKTEAPNHRFLCGGSVSISPDGRGNEMKVTSVLDLGVISCLNLKCYWMLGKDLKGNHFTRWAGQRQSPVSLQLHLITRRLLDYISVLHLIIIHPLSSFHFNFRVFFFGGSYFCASHFSF